MPSRTRTVSKTIVNGFAVSFIGTPNESWYGGESITSRTDRCDDFVGNRLGANPLFIEKRLMNVNPINSPIFGSSANRKQYVNYIGSYWRSLPSGHPQLPGGLPTMANAMSQLYAKTNPNRSEVSIPAFIAELRDLPRTVKDIGSLLISVKTGKVSTHELAKANIVWKFGVAPLIGDVRKLLNFSAAVEGRLKELERLRSHSGLKRRLDFKSESVQHRYYSYIDTSLGAFVTGWNNQRCERKMWGSIRWMPTDPGFALTSSSDMRKLASDAIGGISKWGALEAAWAILPWSWLIDWYANVGDFLAGANNTIPVVAVDPCIMRTTVTTNALVRDANDAFVTGGGGQSIYVTKERYVTRPLAPSASIPILSGSQWSILASLAVLRSRSAQ